MNESPAGVVCYCSVAADCPRLTTRARAPDIEYDMDDSSNESDLRNDAKAPMLFLCLRLRMPYRRNAGFGACVPSSSSSLSLGSVSRYRSDKILDGKIDD